MTSFLFNSYCSSFFGRKTWYDMILNPNSCIKISVAYHKAIKISCEMNVWDNNHIGSSRFFRQQFFRHRIFRNRFSDTKLSGANFPTPNLPTNKFSETTFPDNKFSDNQIYNQLIIEPNLT